LYTFVGYIGIVGNRLELEALSEDMVDIKIPLEKMKLIYRSK